MVLRISKPLYSYTECIIVNLQVSVVHPQRARWDIFFRFLAKIRYNTLWAYISHILKTTPNHTPQEPCYRNWFRLELARVYLILSTLFLASTTVFGQFSTNQREATYVRTRFFFPTYVCVCGPSVVQESFLSINSVLVRTYSFIYAYLPTLCTCT